MEQQKEPNALKGPVFLHLFMLAHYLVFGLAYFCLGILASRQNGQVTTGIIANLWANLWIITVTLIVDILTYKRFYALYSAYTTINPARILFSSYVTTVALSFALGAGLGALGGLLGRSLARHQPQKAAATM